MPGFMVNRSEGLDPNGICYPCVMGWGLAGPGNSSAAAVAAAVAPRGGGAKLQKLEFFKERMRKDGKTHIYIYIYTGESENRVFGN